MAIAERSCSTSLHCWHVKVPLVPFDVKPPAESLAKHIALCCADWSTRVNDVEKARSLRLCVSSVSDKAGVARHRLDCIDTRRHFIQCSPIERVQYPKPVIAHGNENGRRETYGPVLCTLR